MTVDKPSHVFPRMSPQHPPFHLFTVLLLWKVLIPMIGGRYETALRDKGPSARDD